MTQHLQAEGDPARLKDWMAAGLITSLALALHVHRFFYAGGLWRDEVNLISLARENSLSAMAQDSFPVLMPLVTHGWMQVAGESDAAQRLLGALIGLAGIAALWATAWVVRRSPPLLGLALFSLNSFVVIYGDSLRANGLSVALVIAFTAAVWALLERPTPLRFGLAAAVAVLNVQAIFHNAILVAAVCSGGFLVAARRGTWKAARLVFLSGLTAAVSLTPYFSRILLLQAEGASLRTGFRRDVALDNLSLLLRFPLEPYKWVWALLTVVLVAGIVVGWMPQANRNAATSQNNATRERWWFSGVTLFVALLGFAAFLKWAKLPTQVWYFLPLLALASACVEMGLPILTGRWKAMLFGFAAGTALIAFPFAWRDMECRFTNVDLIAKHLNAVASPRDFVLVSPWYRGISFERYYHAPALWNTIPPLSNHSRHRYDLVWEQMRTAGAMGPLVERISAALQDGGRVWLVGSVDVPAAGTPPPADLPPPPLNWSGWSDTPYNLVWDSQVAHFLRDHSTRFEPVAVVTNVCIDFNESPALFVIEGWQTNILSPPPVPLPIR